MWFEVHNTHTEVKNLSERERLWLHHFLTFEDARRADAQPERMYNLRRDRFPTGMLPLVERGAREEGFETDRIDKRVRPGEMDPTADLDWLKTITADGVAFQFEAVKAVVEAGRGILRAPTGSGKGEQVVGIAKSVPIKWMFLVHKKNLRDDIANRWRKRGDGSEPAIAESGSWELGERLTLATFQSVYRNRKDPQVKRMLREAQGMIVDECHTLPAKSNHSVAMAMPNAYYRIGLSGTPLDRSDNKSLTAVATLGPIVYNIPYRTLVKAGAVAEAVVTMVEHQSTGGVKRGAWHEVYRDHVADNPDRNALVMKMIERAAKPCIAFVGSLSQGRTLKRGLVERGVESRFVHGQVKNRQIFCDMLQNGDIDVIVANNVFQEGVDVPALRSVVLAQGMQAKIMILQDIGRGMRLERDALGRVRDESRTFQVWDVMDKGHRWIEAHARSRAATYRKTGFSVTLEDPWV